MSDRATPRIFPLSLDQRDDEAKELLAKANGSPTRDLRVFSTLLRHRHLYRRWAPFAFELLGRGTLPTRDREVLVLRTAYNCSNDYEWRAHVETARRVALAESDIAYIGGKPDAPTEDEHIRLLVEVADELHANHTIGDSTWARLELEYSTEQRIEIPMLVGHYTMLAYTLNALAVAPEED